jgi:hypothetical protein
MAGKKIDIKGAQKVAREVRAAGGTDRQCAQSGVRWAHGGSKTKDVR